jgi:hypothetical protein
MCVRLHRLLWVALLGIVAGPAWAQSPSLDSLGILPPLPTTAVDVMAQVGGTHNTSGQPTIRTELRRIDSDIRLDILIDEFFVGAPAVIEPWSRTESLGILPIGTYILDARLFWVERGIGPSFPDPWPFPDSFGLPLSPGANGMQSMTFTVVPEPSTVLLMLGVAMGVFAGVHRYTARLGSAAAKRLKWRTSNGSANTMRRRDECGT